MIDSLDFFSILIFFYSRVSMDPTQSIQAIQSIKVSDYCFESYPCQHDVCVDVGAGVVKTTLMDDDELIQDDIWVLLSDENKRHFAYLKKYVQQHKLEHLHALFMADPIAE